jgi:FkbM family methyltransferase
MWRDWAYKALGAGGWDDNALVDRNWPSAPQVIRGRVTGMKMALDLTDWMQRRTYFTGRFYQEDLEELLSALVAPGDNFVDVGANIGLVSLHAASLIGPSGKLWAFEPNPEVFARLKRHLEINGLGRSRAFNKGLGSESGKLNLNLFGRHTGKATLVDRGAPAARTVAAEVCRGDEALKDLNPTKPTIFKIDVEGFETPVIRGLGKLLDGNVAVVIEVSKSWLKLAGSSAKELHGLLAGHELEPYGFELAESRVTRRLVVRRLPGMMEDDQYDCLFMRPDSVFAKRLGISLNEQQRGSGNG